MDRDRHVEVSRGVGLGEQGEPIDGLARAVAQVEAVPRQSNEQIGAGVAGGAHAVRLRITAIGDGDVARLDAHAIQRFAFVERGNGEIGDPLAGDIVAQMQPKAGFAGSLDTRAVDEADPIFVRPPPADASRRANRFSQSAISQSPQRRNRMSKATSETSTTPLAAASAASLRKDRPPGA